MRNSERKLRKAGMGQQIDQGQITINGAREVEVAVYYEDDSEMIDFDATESLTAKVAQALEWGGFKCAWGGWVLQKGHKSDFTALLDQFGLGAYNATQ